METIALQQILLADDDAEDRSFFREALSQVLPDSEFSTASNGMEVMNMLFKHPPDMLFLDINMPLKNGIDCIKLIRELKELKKLLVVAYSSAFDQAQITKAYAYGVHLYFIKPTKLSYLIEDLQNLFELDWDHPHNITSAHFMKNSYTAFNTRRG